MHIADETLASLWSRARAMFARVTAAVGAPAAVAALVVLARVQRRAIGAWLTRLEAIVRKLLFAEAGRLPREAHTLRGKPLLTAQISAHKPTPSHTFDAARPETWPARFAFAPPRDPRAAIEAHAPRIRALWGACGDTHAQAAQVTQSAAMRVCHPKATAKHFAIRFEVIRRVLADPAAYARRLARIFHRLRRRFPEAPQRYATAPARRYVFDESDPRLLMEAIAAAIPAAYAFDSS